MTWRVCVLAVLAVAAAIMPVYGPAAAQRATVHKIDTTNDARAAAPVPSRDADMQRIFTERKALFDAMSSGTGMPWYYLAAIDQYERTVGALKKRPQPRGLIAISFSDADWYGPANPNHTDRNVRFVTLFGGKGRDGSGDDLADRDNDLDVLYAMTEYLMRYGVSSDHFRKGLLAYYHNPRSVTRIEQFARIYSACDTLDLHARAFPLPLGTRYTYRDTWGASRGWGGRRIHEGTDLFSGYGLPVRSTCYGFVEEKGWNRYGGWRVGIRDLNNLYHYYAHLSGFAKGLKKGDIITPGQTLGWTGSSGYGKPGTQGKFPPHLHYGLYRDYGQIDRAFDPYRYLLKWEREERERLREARMPKQKPPDPSGKSPVGQR